MLPHGAELVGWGKEAVDYNKSTSLRVRRKVAPDALVGWDKVVGLIKEWRARPGLRSARITLAAWVNGGYYFEEFLMA